MYSKQLTLYGEDLYFLGYKVATLSVPFPTLLDRIAESLDDSDKDDQIEILQEQNDLADERISELEEDLCEANREIRILEEALDKIQNIASSV